MVDEEQPILYRAAASCLRVLFSHSVLIHLLLIYHILNGLQMGFSVRHLLMLFRAFLELN